MTAITFVAKNISSTWDRGANPLDYPIAPGVTVGLGQAVYLDDNNQLQLAIGTSAKAANVLGVVSGVPQQYAETSSASPASGPVAYASVVSNGRVFGFNGSTPALIDGQAIYLSKTVPGGLDTAPPASPGYSYMVAKASGSSSINVSTGQSAPASL